MPDSFKTRIGKAVRGGNGDPTAEIVQHELAAAIRTGEIELEPRFREAKPGGYARRLWYRDMTAGYTAVVMAWAPGQATPIHDHAGIWCVEGVLEGEVEVTRYAPLRQRGELMRFSSQPTIRAGVGCTGCLIPPHEYHVLANVTDSLAITLHLYGGEMNSCNVFIPKSYGWFERVNHALAYDE